MKRHAERPYRTEHSFYILGAFLIAIALGFLAIFAYGICLPRYESHLFEARSRLTPLLGEYVSDAIRRGQADVAQARLSRFVGVDGITSIKLVTDAEKTIDRNTGKTAFETVISSGAPNSPPLAKLVVFFSQEEESLAQQFILVFLSVTFSTAAILLMAIARTCRRLFIKPMSDIARLVGETNEIREILPSAFRAIEFREVVKAVNQRLSAIKFLTDENVYQGQKDAVVRMTRKLAHDVKKPFSILRMGLNLLNTARDPDGIKSILGRLVPEVEKAMGHIDGLIADILEISSPPVSQDKESLSPETLIESALSDISRMFPYTFIELTYDINHNHNVLVNSQKVGRVFSSILINAVQALGQNVEKSGNIWFRTRDIDGFVEFCIGNSGSTISSDMIPRLFDDFFTSARRTGTGLGLAMAHKVISESGGTIWCESRTTASHPNGLVEFFFTLPMTKEGVHKICAMNLPPNTQAIVRDFPSKSSKAPGDSNTMNCYSSGKTLGTNTNLSNENRNQQGLSSTTKPEVAVVEDNLFILEAWVETLSHDAKVYAATSPEAFYQLLSNDLDLLQRLACVVTDLHFDNSTLNGVDVGKCIKRGRPNLPTLLSSDGWLSPEEMIAAIDCVIPKEVMTYGRLKEFI